MQKGFLNEDGLRLGAAPDNAKLINALIDAQTGLAPIHHDLEDEYYDMDLALGFG